MSEEHKARARDLVETAVRLFANCGFDGVSVRDICEELSVNCSTVSYYFKSKKGLYLAALKSQFTACAAMMAEALSQNLEPREALSSIIDTFHAFHNTHPHFASLISRESVRPSPEFTRAAEEFEQRFADALAGIIRNGQRQGLFKGKLKIAAVVAVINVLLKGAAPDGEYFETVKMLLSDGLAADPHESGPGIGKQSAKPRYRA